MQQKLLPEERDAKRNRRRFARKWIAGALACVMGLSTTMALAPSAFAQAGTEQKEDATYTCGLEAHTHSEKCYEKVTAGTERVLFCTLQSQPAQAAEETQKTIVHKHDAACYDKADALVCALTELEAHTHGAECYTAPVLHAHGETCYTMGEELTCGKEASEGHQHSDTCNGKVLSCELHVCDESCAEPCTVEQDPHVHTDECYQQLVCNLTEAEAHAHTDECYKALTCGKTEGEKEADGTLICEKEERKLHTHTVDQQCYLVTYNDDGTIATETLNCDTPVVEEHIHADACFTTVETPAADVDTLTCGKEVSEAHEHTAQCYGTWKLTCELEEHTHDETCDPLAGLSEEDRAKVQAIIDAIDKMPSADEYDAELAKLEDAENYDGMIALQQKIYDVYDLYDALSEELKAYVTNADKLLELEYVWSVRPMYTRADYSLNGFSGASTREFITMNLYNYGSGINANYNSNKEYPGFQLPDALKTGSFAADKKLDSGEFNFGDVITADRGAQNVTAKDANGKFTNGAINALNTDAGAANRPISGAIADELKNGYPALANNRGSLSYLFSKPTNANVDGLFQYDSATGNYHFDSRVNHAQISGSQFTLYGELITSNALMYPFGNFLPFNNINTQTTRASDINSAYIADIQNKVTGNFKTRLGEFNSLMGSNWTYQKALTAYLKACGKEGYSTTNTKVIAPANKLYNIDYDVATDFFFGMDMHMSFLMPKDGKVNGNNMVYSFTGDDDVLVYIDGKLFLDLSGIHRHVGGKIDFAEGKVYYYQLNSVAGSIGDISTSAYKTVTFAEILGSSANLEGGTFKDYTTHKFDFYYMERGSGSSVCSINFNFPLLKKNSITVAKDVTFTSAVEDSLGDPSFKFQVLKADNNGTKTNELFIPGNTSYTLIKADGSKTTATTDANGVFTLKKGQKAEFTGISENSGKYYVRELLDANVAGQYDNIMVDGKATTTTNNVTVGTSTFTGRDSTVKDISEGGATYFAFENKIDPKKMGSLKISKVLTKYDDAADANYPDFDIVVELDGVAKTYPIGMGETEIIDNILAGSTFKVYEENASGYVVSYSLNGGTAASTVPTGIVPAKDDPNSKEPTVEIVVTNAEKGIEDTISGTKTLTNPNGTERTYYFVWVEGSFDAANNTFTAVEGDPNVMTVNLAAETGSGAFSFSRKYTEKMLGGADSKDFYYEIYESDAQGNSLADTGALDADQAVYVVKVTVAKDAAGDLTATKTIYKDGVEATGNDAQVSFTNTLLGDLEITKELKLQGGSSVPVTKTFTMTVKKPDGTALAAGTAYTVTDKDGAKTTKQVGTGGTIELTAGATALIEGLAVGDTYTVTEAETSAYGYEVSYSPESVTIVEKTEETPSVSIAVTNTELMTDVKIPILKNVTNPDGRKHTFTFCMTQANADGTVKANAPTDKIELEISGAEAKAIFSHTYKGTDLAGKPSETFYYLITEDTASDLTLDADESKYLVEVELTGGNDMLSAQVQSIKKIVGTTQTDADEVSFTNTLLGRLMLNKKIVGSYPEGETFQFTIKGIPDGIYETVLNGEARTVTVTNQTCTVELGHKDSLVIYGIPHGTQITVTEAKSEYTVRYKVNDNFQRKGSTASAEVTTSGTEILFRNYSPYGLPQTGQLNWPILVLAVLGLACVSGGVLMLRRKKGKHEK